MSYEGIDVGCIQRKVGASQLGTQQETFSHRLHIKFVSYGHKSLHGQNIQHGFIEAGMIDAENLAVSSV
jgi:hypothetical protein